MMPNKNPDHNLIKKLRQYFETDPRPDFLPGLKDDLVNQVADKPSPLQHHRPRKTAFILASALTALVLLLFITPVRDAIGQIFVELFHQTESNVLPDYTRQTAIAALTATPAPDSTNTPEVTRTPDLTGFRNANMSVEEVEQVAGFDVLVPAKVSSLFKFRGASYYPEENITNLYYDLVGRNTNGFSISQEPITSEDDCDLCSDIGPAANVYPIEIGNAYGEYVVGQWIYEDGNQVWVNNPWFVTMRWQTGDTVYQISSFSPPMTMTKSNMVNIAESLASSNDPLAWFSVTPTATPQDAVKTPDPAKIENATMSLDEVKAAAGFEILTPSYLAGQEFSAANYDEETKIVYLFYGEELLIRQEPFTSMADCQLCIETRYGASVKQALVGDIEAEYLYGLWPFVDANNQPFAIPQPKQLRWQENNTFFDIIYDHDPSKLELDDLIAIAESLQ